MTDTVEGNIALGRRYRLNHPASATMFAVGSFGLALLVRKWLGDWLPPGFPFLTFFPAVILTAYLAGWRSAVLCTTLSTLAAWYWFIPPEGTFKLDSTSALALSFFVFVAGVIISVMHQMQVALDRLATEQQAVTRLYDIQLTMFQELQHRVANNMMFVAALLSLHRKEIESDPVQAVRLIDEAKQRLTVMSRIHRKLYDPESAQVPLDEYFSQLARDILDATSARNIVAIVDTGDCKLGIERLMTLSMLVTEVMTNSLKHAFPDRRQGTISLSLKSAAADQLVLVVADDGVGQQQAAVKAKANPGLGSRIIDSLVRQLGGQLTVESRPLAGTTIRVVFAAA